MNNNNNNNKNFPLSQHKKEAFCEGGGESGDKTLEKSDSLKGLFDSLCRGSLSDNQ